MNDQLIGKYRVIRKIGAGGMASVFLAVHKDIPNLHVVLKKLGDPDLVERFKREADKLAALDGHPGICQIKHFFDHDGVFYIAMEYIDGQTLQDLIESQRQLDLGRALFLTRTILDILETAHNLGISHRDIKPTNIMLDRNENLKIIDFGLAKSETDPQLTHVGTYLGTPLYMAPEQFNPPEGMNSISCDIYAVGIVLYFMLTGKLPHAGNNLVQIIESKLKTDVIQPTTYNPDIPPNVEATILKAIAHDPRDRFASAAEMKIALVSGPRDMDRILENLETASVDPGGETVALGADTVVTGAATAPPGPSAAPGSPRRRRLPVWVIPAGIVAVAALAFGLKPLLTRSPDTLAEGPPAHTLATTAAADSVPAETGGTPIDTVATRPDRPRDDRAGNPPPDAVPVQAAATEPTTNSTTGAASEAEVETGSLIVGSLPFLGARIYLDGVDTEQTTPYTLTIPAGEHLVKVVFTTNGVPREMEEKVRVEAGQSQKKIFRFN